MFGLTRSVSGRCFSLRKDFLIHKVDHAPTFFEIGIRDKRLLGEGKNEFDATLYVRMKLWMLLVTSCRRMNGCHEIPRGLTYAYIHKGGPLTPR